MKYFVMILGMHRSGTSFLARALNLGGVYLGGLDSLTSHEWMHEDDNLRGHWENRGFSELCEKTLVQNNGSWYDIPQNITIDEHLGNEIRKHSNEIMNHASLASGFKDPRLVILYDAWHKYLPKNLLIVGIFRHPLKVAESLKNRDGFSYEQSLKLWKTYNEKLLSILEKHDGFLLNFDWPKGKLLSELKVVFEKTGLAKDANLSEWFSENLLHSDHAYEHNYPLSQDLISLYSKLEERSEKNKTVELDKVSPSEDEFTNILQTMIGEVDTQGRYFKKLNEKNLAKIDDLQNSMKQPLNSLLKIYRSRPDLQKSFPEVENGNFQSLLNWACNTPIASIGNESEKEAVETYRPIYKLELEKTTLQELTKTLQESKSKQEAQLNKMAEEGRHKEAQLNKMAEEGRHKEAQLNKMAEEAAQQKHLYEKTLFERSELEEDLRIAHGAVQQRERERQALAAELSGIKESVSWNIMTKVQGLLARIFPPKTKRGNFLYLVLQFMRYSSTHGLSSATREAVSFVKKTRTQILDVNAQVRSQFVSWRDQQNFDSIQIEKMKKEITAFTQKPKISVVMPVYNVDEKWLRMAIGSVTGQIYENWELCIADDASTRPHIRNVLQEYSKKDPRIKVRFLEKNLNIAGASNEALSLVTGEYVGLLDHDDEIYPDALYEVAKAINSNKNLEIIYSDENHISPNGERIDAFFKPDYSPDLLMTCHYMVHLIVYKTSLLRELEGFRRGFDGSQDYDLILRAVERTDKIHHIPRPLYGWRNIPTSTASGGDAKPYAQIAAKKALEDALKRRKIDGTPEYLPELGYFKINYNLKRNPLVSIIITTRDRPDLLSRLLSSIESKTTYDNYEIIVVDHLSQKKETMEFLESIKHRVIRYEKEFNIPNLFNFAEQHAKGEYLLTMNDDLEVITGNWIESMLGPCQRDEVAIVGAQLIYPDASAQENLVRGQTIQHAGVVLGVGGIASHAFRHVNYLDNGYFALNKTLRNYSAVTGACMLVKRDVYKRLKGYDPALKVAYNDVDFCLRARNEGYLIVYTPYAKLYHYEGASRGLRQPTDDARIFVERWKEVLLKRDPYYNVNLTLLREDFGLSFYGIPINETPLALLLEIYANRSDLQKSFPEVALGQYENLINWAKTYGCAGPKYGLPPDMYSHILTLYKFWYEENSRTKGRVVEQHAA